MQEERRWQHAGAVAAKNTQTSRLMHTLTRAQAYPFTHTLTFFLTPIPGKNLK